MSRLSLVLALAMATPAVAFAQSEPYKVFDTRPVITEGPYLIATGTTTATVVWLTDAPSHSLVRYARGAGLAAAALTQSAEPQQDGLVPVGLRHVVHLTGLEPGATYSYQVVSTRVVKLKAYWPDKGLAIESPVYSLTTLDPHLGPAAVSVLEADDRDALPIVEGLHGSEQRRLHLRAHRDLRVTGRQHEITPQTSNPPSSRNPSV